MENLAALSKGFGVTLGLIVAIGAQNALLLSHAIRNQHQRLIAAICIVLDFILITSGVLGLGALVVMWPILMDLFRWCGAAFLFWYGWAAFMQARNPGTLRDNKSIPTSRRDVILMTLAVSLLNPHVYLDTVILIGSIGAQIPAEHRMSFLGGAWCASALWFLSLCAAGRMLQPLFKKEKAWRILYTFVGITMWVIALTLLTEF